MSEMDEKADALDAVPREHRGCHWEEEARRYCGNAGYWRDRAERAEAKQGAAERAAHDLTETLERAERERDRLREAWNELLADAERVADEPEIGLDPGRTAFTERYRTALDLVSRARAALSTDAEPDRYQQWVDANPGLLPEPETCGAPPPPDGVTGPCQESAGHGGMHKAFDDARMAWRWCEPYEEPEPSRAENESPLSDAASEVKESGSGLKSEGDDGSSGCAHQMRAARAQARVHKLEAAIKELHRALRGGSDGC